MPDNNTIHNNWGWNFDNSYSRLPAQLFAMQQPTAVTNPQIAIFNTALAAGLGLQTATVSEGVLAAVLSGNRVPPGAAPIAQAYAGHQFGHFTMLGDGRAILLGEHISPAGQPVDIQLKGAGQTPYSRRGDGRATLSAMLREYTISEAMHHLGIASTRSLAVVTTGEKVMRETVQAGAVLTRVAASHIRVGTFEYVSHFHDTALLEQLVNYTLQKHYPGQTPAANKPLALLNAVIEQQAFLIAQWMRVGFIHGVMNTDNMSLAGETIDYGPCAFMNVYDPATVYSAIDEQGRYAYGNQPAIAHWNLACLATALLPLLHTDSTTATAMAQEALDKFPVLYKQAWHSAMLQKLGLTPGAPAAASLIADLLQWMLQHKADYTNTFLVLQGIEVPDAALYNNAAFTDWLQRWQRLTCSDGILNPAAAALMQKTNPVFIPRNHRVEAALQAAALSGDYTLLHELLNVLSNPYTVKPGREAYMIPPPATTERYYQTFCGT